MIAEAPVRFRSPYDPTPYDVNRGWCHDWAVELCALMPEAKHCLFGNFDCGHSFVKIGRQYFDAECLDGVYSWRNIPLLRNLMRPIWEDLREEDVRILEQPPQHYIDRNGFRKFL